MSSPSGNCLLHPDRKAAARCPECGEIFCRECVTEHSGKYLCIKCLEIRLGGKEKDKSSSVWKLFGELSGAIFGIGMLALVFFLIGKILLAIPSTFHWIP